MAENAEMRIHVGDSAQTLRGVERVGGWFLRGDAGLRMIPGGVRDTGNTYEADVLVVVTAAPSVESSLPGVPRFYEAEILAASMSRKPVTLLGRQAEFQLPPSAYEG